MGSSASDESSTVTGHPGRSGGTPIRYAEEVRFQKPIAPTFGYPGSALSILSLLVLAAVATILWGQLKNPGAVTAGGFLPSILAPLSATSGLAAWTWIPFLFTMFGAGIGFVFELGLMLAGIPFQQARNGFTIFVRSVRLLNLAPVVGSIFFFVCCIAVPTSDMRLALLYGVALVGSGLAFALFFGGAEMAAGATILGTQVVQIVLVLRSPLPGDGRDVAWFLIAQAALQMVALLIGTATPIRSTGVHLISAISPMMLYGAIRKISEGDPGFSDRVAVSLPLGSLAFWAFIASALAGVLLVTRVFPKTYHRWRAIASNLVWSLPNFLLVSNPRFPDPKRLSEVYGGKMPKPIRVRPYYQEHPEFLVQSLSIPEAMRLPMTVTDFRSLVKLVKQIFRLIQRLDHLFPQADIQVPIEHKPRLEIWSDGSEYWPSLFRRKLFGRTIPDSGAMEPTPRPIIEAFQAGQLLAYLTESGIASTLVRRVEDPEATLVLDFTRFENYETKRDYESYGGRAYFWINSEKKRLELLSVVAPHSTVKVEVNPHDPTFRHAESLVLASLYYHVISGKHLAEIHMTYALVEIALHNAFDAQGQWNHPFRSFLYLHLFAHGLAETLTTEHLVQDGAVFPQIFATTEDGLIRHLNDCYTGFQYGDDEDFQERAKLMMTVDGEILPKACIRWELKYAEIWQRYTKDLIDIIYDDDAAVRADTCLQEFHRDLNTFFLKGLPERYESLETKAGVARYAADTIHHLVVRHQVYGTTSVKAALDPRISKVQVPRDTGTTPVDEWRSLASVALATERARFTLLFGDFKYLLDNVDGRYKEPMRRVFDELQEHLRTLDADWSKTDEDKRFNYDYFRPIPSALHTGAGY